MKLQDEKFIKETGEYFRESMNKAFWWGFTCGFLIGPIVVLIVLMALF